MKLSTKQDYQKCLKENICCVVFTRRGVQTTLICTLKPQHYVGPIRIITVPTNSVSCFNVLKEEWDSFTVDSVKGFSVLEETDSLEV